ncbi:K homology domain-containing protein [Tanacetum coccineum]
MFKNVDFTWVSTDRIPPFIIGGNDDDNEKTHYSDSLNLGPEYKYDESEDGGDWDDDRLLGFIGLEEDDHAGILGYMWTYLFQIIDKSRILAPSSVSSAYGYGNPRKTIDIPNGRVGVIIGKSGETIKYLQAQCEAKIQVTRDMDADPNSQIRGVELTGSLESIAKAKEMIRDVLAKARGLRFWRSFS